MSVRFHLETWNLTLMLLSCFLCHPKNVIYGNFNSVFYFLELVRPKYCFFFLLCVSSFPLFASSVNQWWIKHKTMFQLSKISMDCSLKYVGQLIGACLKFWEVVVECELLLRLVLCVLPLVDTQPDTHEVDRSEIRTQILLATASSSLKGYRSFTRMLAEVRPQK